MQIQFDLKFRDMYVFNTVHQFMSPVVQVFNAGLPLLILSTDPESKPLAYTIFVLVFIYLLLWAAQLVFNLIYLALARNRTMLTHYAVAIVDDGLHYETPYQKTQVFWSGLLKVVVRPGFVAVYLSGHSAVLIPKRAFGSKAQREEFVESIRARIADRPDV